MPFMEWKRVSKVYGVIWQTLSQSFSFNAIYTYFFFILSGLKFKMSYSYSHIISSRLNLYQKKRMKHFERLKLISPILYKYVMPNFTLDKTTCFRCLITLPIWLLPLDKCTIFNIFRNPSTYSWGNGFTVRFQWAHWIQDSSWVLLHAGCHSTWNWCYVQWNQTFIAAIWIYCKKLFLMSKIKRTNLKFHITPDHSGIT